MRSVFLDTGYLLAIEVDSDQHHLAAVQHWRETQTNAPLILVTTSLVFTEVVSLLKRRGRHDTAVKVGNNLLQSSSVHFVHVERDLFREGWSYFQQHEDKHYSLTDCVSFVVMQRLKIATAFAFDHHFRQAGFATEPI
jgi:uncharacterized protein